MNGELLIRKDLLEIEGVTNKFVTIRISNQLFSVAAINVECVLLPRKITPVPLASSEILGLMNLHGRIVTAIDLRIKMGMETPENRMGNKSIIVNHQDNLYGFIVDEVIGVHDISTNEIEHNPENFSDEEKEYCSGAYKFENELMIILNVKKLLGFTQTYLSSENR